MVAFFSLSQQVKNEKKILCPTEAHQLHSEKTWKMDGKAMRRTHKIIHINFLFVNVLYFIFEINCEIKLKR